MKMGGLAVAYLTVYVAVYMHLGSSKGPKSDNESLLIRITPFLEFYSKLTSK